MCEKHGQSAKWFVHSGKRLQAAREWLAESEPWSVREGFETESVRVTRVSHANKI
jgi:hypothetical protein